MTRQPELANFVDGIGKEEPHDAACTELDDGSNPLASRAAGIVRHMRPTQEGNLLIHQSSTKRVILVEVSP